MHGQLNLQSAADFSEQMLEISMRQKWLIVRDTMVVLSMQIIFRGVMLMRRLNY